MRPFGGKVSGKVIPFPGLDVRYPVAFQSGLEVNLRGPLERAELRFKWHDKDEASDTVHTVGRLPLLEATKQGLNDVGRHIVYLFVASEHGRFLGEVANHHASELRESLAASHELPVDDGDTLHGRPSGKAGVLTEREHFAEAGHDLAEFLDQSSVLPDEGVHAPLLGSELSASLHHILGPVEDVHPSGKCSHVVGHQVVNVCEDVMPGIPYGLGEQDELLVRAVNGLQVRPEGVADVPMPLDSRLSKAFYEVATVVRHGIFRGTAELGSHTTHSGLDILALMGGGHVDVSDFHVGTGKRVSGMLRRHFQGKQDLVFRNGDALVHDDGVGLLCRHILAAMFVHIKAHLQHPITYGGMGDFGKSQGRVHKVHHFHRLSGGTEAASRICVQQCRHLDYFFRVPVSFDMSNAITSAARSSAPAATSFF